MPASPSWKAIPADTNIGNSANWDNWNSNATNWSVLTGSLFYPSSGTLTIPAGANFNIATGGEVLPGATIVGTSPTAGIVHVVGTLLGGNLSAWLWLSLDGGTVGGTYGGVPVGPTLGVQTSIQWTQASTVKQLSAPYINSGNPIGTAGGLGLSAADLRYNTAVGNITGSCRVPAASDVRHGTSVDATTGTCYVPTASQTLYNIAVDSSTGTVSLPNNSSPSANGDVALVRFGMKFGADNSQIGTFTGGNSSADLYLSGLEARFGCPVIRTSQIVGIHIYDPFNAPDTIQDDATLLNAALASLEGGGCLFVDGVHAFLADLIVPSGVKIKSPDHMLRLHRFGDLKGGTLGNAIRNKNQHKGHPQPEVITSYTDLIYPGFVSSLPLRLKNSLSNVATSCTLETNQGKLLDPAPGSITIDGEVMSYSAITGDVLTIARGQHAEAHDAVAIVAETIMDHDIEIEVGIDCHADSFSYNYRMDFTANPPVMYFNCGASLVGVHDLDISGLTIENNPCWAVLMSNISGRLVVNESRVKSLASNAGDDGWHLHGPCEELVLCNCTGFTSDNTLAINFGEIVLQGLLSWPGLGSGDVGRVTCIGSHLTGTTYPAISICGGPMCTLDTFEIIDTATHGPGRYGSSIFFQEIGGTSTVVKHLIVNGLRIESDAPDSHPMGDPNLITSNAAIYVGNAQCGTIELCNITHRLATTASRLIDVASLGVVDTLIRDGVYWEGQSQQLLNAGTITHDIEVSIATTVPATPGDVATALTTYGANTVTPPTESAVATATAAAILATPENKIVTNGTGQVEASNEGEATISDSDLLRLRSTVIAALAGRELVALEWIPRSGSQIIYRGAFYTSELGRQIVIPFDDSWPDLSAEGTVLELLFLPLVAGTPTAWPDLVVYGEVDNESGDVVFELSVTTEESVPDSLSLHSGNDRYLAEVWAVIDGKGIPLVEWKVTVREGRHDTPS